MTKQKLMVLTVLLVGVLFFTACGGNDEDNGEVPGENGEDTGEMIPEEGIDFSEFDGDDPVIRVNGEDILFSEYEEEFERTKNMAAMQYGIDFEDSEQAAMITPQLQQQAIETMINQRILLQEAEDQGIEVTDEEIDQNIDELTQQFGGEEGLQEAMELEGLTEDSLRNVLYDNLMISSLFEVVLDFDEIEVTDEEVEEYYAQLEASWEQQGQESTPLEEIEPRIIEQLQQQKAQEIQMAYLDELLDDSEIETLF